MQTNSLRKRLRDQRLQLSSKQQNLAARRLKRNACRCYPLLFAQRVVTYQAFAGELSPALLTSALSSTFGKAEIFLPRIYNFRQRLMHFHSQRQPLKPNRYGILEPVALDAPQPATFFDVILVPLVAFDRQGNRLGMGAGYYDRALASMRHQSDRRPMLIGIAHHFQEVKSLAPDPWDIPMHAVITDQEYIPISSQLSLHSKAVRQTKTLL